MDKLKNDFLTKKLGEIRNFWMKTNVLIISYNEEQKKRQSGKKGKEVGEN